MVENTLEVQYMGEWYDNFSLEIYIIIIKFSGRFLSQSEASVI